MARQKTPDPPPAPADRIGALLADGGLADYSAFFDHLLALAVAVREELAARLAPRLAVQARAMPHGTYAEKQELAKWVNGQLRQLGLAVRCPKTGRAAILVADHGPNPEKGRFQVQTVHDRKRTLSSVELPEFALLPADLRQDYVKSPRKKQSD
jgi:hypothetical protein